MNRCECRNSLRFDVGVLLLPMFAALMEDDSVRFVAAFFLGVLVDYSSAKFASCRLFFNALQSIHQVGL